MTEDNDGRYPCFRAKSGRAREVAIHCVGLITVLTGGVSSKLFAAPQGIDEQEQEQSAQEHEAPVLAPVATTLDWKAQARLHHGLEGSPDTLTLNHDGVVFRPTKGTTLHYRETDSVTQNVEHRQG